MKRTLRHSRLLCLAFDLSAVVAFALFIPVCTQYKFSIAFSDARKLQRDVDFIAAEYREPTLTVQELNDWLSSKLPPEHLLCQIQPPPGNDPWGKPYRCVDGKREPADQSGEFGIYSTGRDGVSQTNGDDPDDLNSWDRESYRTYSAEVTRNNLLMLSVPTIALTPVVYVFLLAFGQGVRRVILKS